MLPGHDAHVRDRRRARRGAQHGQRRGGRRARESRRRGQQDRGRVAHAHERAAGGDDERVADAEEARRKEDAAKAAREAGLQRRGVVRKVVALGAAVAPRVEHAGRAKVGEGRLVPKVLGDEVRRRRDIVRLEDRAVRMAHTGHGDHVRDVPLAAVDAARVGGEVQPGPTGRRARHGCGAALRYGRAATRYKDVAEEEAAR